MSIQLQFINSVLSAYPLSQAERQFNSYNKRYGNDIVEAAYWVTLTEASFADESMLDNVLNHDANPVGFFLNRLPMRLQDMAHKPERRLLPAIQDDVCSFEALHSDPDEPACVENLKESNSNVIINPVYDDPDPGQELKDLLSAATQIRQALARSGNLRESAASVSTLCGIAIRHATGTDHECRALWKSDPAKLFGERTINWKTLLKRLQRGFAAAADVPGVSPRALEVLKSFLGTFLAVFRGGSGSARKVSPKKN